MTYEEMQTIPMTDAMKCLGYRHQRDEHSASDGSHPVWRGEEYLGRYTAKEMFEKIALDHYGIATSLADLA